MTSATDPNGRVTKFNYNQQELVVLPEGGTLVSMPHSYVESVETPTGTVRIDLDIPNFRTSTVTDQNNKVTRYTLDKRGSPLTVTNDAGTTTTTWMPNDVLMLSKMDGRGVLTTYDYDAAGNKIYELTDGKSLRWTYLIQNDVPFIKDHETSHTDRNGNQHVYELDGAGNVRKEMLPEGVNITHSYA
ncbi:hypothetical protein LP420_39950 [Massilia sp. B-10]|nr:hypothetical protein LP420_39950 [Massilia sp. B-10]